MATEKKYLMAAAGAAGGVAADYWINVSGDANGDYGYAVATDSSDNIIIAGYTDPSVASIFDILVAKYDSSGTLLWERTLGNSGHDRGYGVAVDSSDNIIVAGYTTSDGAGGEDLLIAKYSSSGTLLWDRTLGGTGNDQGYGVAVDSSDNIIVAGYTYSDGVRYSDLLVAKYNSSGTLLWDRTLGGSSYDAGQGVAVDSSDNIIVVGYTRSDGAGSYDLLIAKYSSTGTLLWDRTLGGSGNDFGYGVAIDSSDNIIVFGDTTSDGAGGADFLVAKYDSTGILLWDRTLGGANVDYGRSAATDSSGNIVVIGYTTSDGAGNYDILVAKYSSSGTLLWDRTLGGTGYDWGFGVTTDSSDNIIITGQTNSDGAGGSDLLVAKLPPDGSLEGTYGAFTYQAPTLLTDAPAVLTDAPAVLTDAAAVLTDAAAVLTEKKLYALYTIA